MRRGFTLLEVIFVIVILGVMSKFGVELLYKMYENYIYSNTYNRLAGQSELALKQIANRLQYRIKDMTIARLSSSSTDVITIGDASNSDLANATVLEWVGIDSDGWRDTGTPLWSGFIDLRNAATTATSLVSPGSSATAGSGALFFIGSNVDIGTNADWNNAMIPVTVGTDVVTPTASLLGQDVYEFYQFSKSAYAVELVNKQLILYSGYQPWNGGSMTNGQVLMEDVTTFQFRSLGDSLMIQVCVSDNDVSGLGEYSICKEKVVF